jgi:DNA mismatch repair protein MutL
VEPAARPRVQRLDDVVVDQIAAGEVVERPASVVKELVENALDAGATRVLVELKDGGTSLIRIVDDGCGMSRADAELALERHATSKIRSADDLVGVATLGFRGEAVPSIASVSRFELITRPAEEDIGTRIVVEGGRRLEVEDAGCAAGTELRVRDLFFNIPARRKFLRTPQNEGQHATEAIVRLSLGRPDVAFTVRAEGRDVIVTRACADLATRAREVLGTLARPLVPVSFARRGLTVQGLASPQGVHQADSQVSYLYVNGRFVRDPVLRRAVLRAYEDLVPRGRHPVVVLSIHVPPEDVDVNVHPAKTEVRFRDPRGLVDAIAEGLRSVVAPLPAVVRESVPVAPSLPLPGFANVIPSFRPEIRPPVAPGVAAHPDDDPALRGLPAPAPIPADGDEASSGSDGPEPGMRRSEGAAGEVASARPGEPPQALASPSRGWAALARASAPAPDEGTPSPPGPAGAAEPPWWLSGLAAPGAPSEQATTTLVARIGAWGVVQRGEALYLADLAALADRLARGRFDAAVARGEIEHRLFTPRVVSVGRSATKLLEADDALLALGVALEGFGGGEIAITSVPLGIPESRAAELVRRLAQAPDAAGTIVHAMLVEEALREPPPVSELGPGTLRQLDEAALKRLWGQL